MALISVLKYGGGPEVFAWKHPCEDLGTWTQLIVSESQEAVLFKDGKALDVFSAGRHTLETANIPLLNKLINLPFGGRSPFAAEVWFINKAYNLDVKWGTPSPIQIQDPKYGIFAPVRANGIFGIQVETAKDFLIKLVGTLPFFDKDNIIRYFRGLYISKIKDTISSYLIHKQISILEINAYLEELSAYLKESLAPVVKDYGIALKSFYVNDISVPEEDPAVKQLKSALAKRAEMDIIGYDYRQERSFNTLEGAAKNSGGTAAPLMGAGLGLGMGVGMGKSVGQGFGGMAQELDITGSGTAEAHVKCSSCGAPLAKKSKFCPECGKKVNACPKCSAPLPVGVKFCPECGESLSKSCPKCGKAVVGSPKFCPDCGQQL